MAKKKQHNIPVKPIPLAQPPKFKKLWIRIILVIAVFILYGSSINYEFTVDDNIFFLKHTSVQKGLSGIGETFTYGSLEKYNGMKGVQPYRPVTLISFAVQKELFENSPAKAHLVNVLLYIFLLLVIFNLLVKLLPGINPLVCGLIVLLFAAHPVHTEVVASVKSQDELLSALFSLLALSYAISLVKSERYSLKFSFLSILCFSLALLSKEGAFAMILLFPLAFWLLSYQSIKRSLIYSIPYIGAGLIFLFIRHLVFAGEIQNYHNTILENILSGAGNFAEASATRMEILFHYLRLLFVPWPLSWDYSYNQIPLVNWSSVLAWLSVLVYAGMLVYAIVKIKKKPVISFGIFFYLIMLAPTSNLFFLNGSTLSERFLFLPSLGYILVIVFAFAELLKVNLADLSGVGRNKFFILMTTILVLFSGLTMARCSDWQSNFTIFKAGVVNAPSSSRTNAALGNEYRKLGESESNPQERFEDLSNAVKYTQASLNILPINKDALYNLGVTYSELRDTANAIASYRKLVDYYPDYRSGLNNMGTIYISQNRFDSAYIYLKRSYDCDTTFPKSSQNLAIYFFKIKDYTHAIQYAIKAIQLDRNMKISYEILIQAYGILGNADEVSKYRRLYQDISTEVPEVNEPTID